MPLNSSTSEPCLWGAGHGEPGRTVWTADSDTRPSAGQKVLLVCMISCNLSLSSFGGQGRLGRHGAVRLGLGRRIHVDVHAHRVVVSFIPPWVCCCVVSDEGDTGSKVCMSPQDLGCLPRWTGTYSSGTVRLTWRAFCKALACIIRSHFSRTDRDRPCSLMFVCLPGIK